MCVGIIAPSHYSSPGESLRQQISKPQLAICSSPSPFSMTIKTVYRNDTAHRLLPCFRFLELTYSMVAFSPLYKIFSPLNAVLRGPSVASFTLSFPFSALRLLILLKTLRSVSEGMAELGCIMPESTSAKWCWIPLLQMLETFEFNS